MGYRFKQFATTRYNTSFYIIKTIITTPTNAVHVHSDEVETSFKLSAFGVKFPGLEVDMFGEEQTDT